MRLKIYQARGNWSMQRLQYFNKAGGGESEGVLEIDETHETSLLLNLILVFLKTHSHIFA